ncbi:MAG: hypothetical protein JO022_07305, partial [Acidobacteriaceae bacterium]|nr:hypothetical protein [Acidobacteriaceae bacterium]
DRRGGAVNVKFHPESKVDPVRLMNVVSQTAGAQFTPAGILRLPVEQGVEAGQLLTYLTESLNHLA